MAAKSSPRRGAEIRLVVVHTNEGNNPADVFPDRTAENLAAYLDRPTVQASYHKIVDDDSTVSYLPDSVASWSIPGGNALSLNVCLTGWARWSRAEWLTHPVMLRRAANLTRIWCAAHDLPLRKLSPAQVGAGERGICGHVDWTKGARRGTHTDPGVGFPWDVFMGLVKPDTGDDDDMSAKAEQQIEEIHRELTQRLPSRSDYAKPPWSDTQFGTVLNAEGRAHEVVTELRALVDALPRIIREQVAAVLKEQGRA